MIPPQHVPVLALLLLGKWVMGRQVESYDESLNFYTITGGLVAAHFKFHHTLGKPSPLHHMNYGHFPRPMVELASTYELEALRVSLTRGRWYADVWGSPPLEPASLGFDVQATSRIRKGEEEVWRRLTATLSGIFCASSNMIDERRSFRPALTTTPLSHEGLITMRAYLVGEAVCTENLTPWSKLLPCATEAGLASLLNPLRIFNSSFHQFDVQLRRTETNLELIQNLLVVFDLARYDRPLDWTLRSLFDRTILRLCPVSESTRLNIIKPILGLPHNWKAQVTTSDEEGKSQFTLDKTTFVDMELVGKSIGVYGSTVGAASLLPGRLRVTRFFSGVGQDRGGLAITWRNLDLEHSASITHRELLPDYLYLFLSQATASGPHGPIPLSSALTEIHVAPAVLRRVPIELQLQLSIPPGSLLTLQIPFEKGFLRYTDFPFDPNRGFDVGGAIVTYGMSSDPQTVHTLVTPKLLLTMATPDFTMPYNVITLTSTIIVLFYGTIFNICYRRFYRRPTPLDRLRARIVERGQKGWHFLISLLGRPRGHTEPHPHQQ